MAEEEGAGFIRILGLPSYQAPKLVQDGSKMVSRAGPSQLHPWNSLQGLPGRAGEGGVSEGWGDGIAAMGAAVPQTGRIRAGAKRQRALRNPFGAGPQPAHSAACT